MQDTVEVLSPLLANFINMLPNYHTFQRNIKFETKIFILEELSYLYKYRLLYKSYFFTVTLCKSSLCKSPLIPFWERLIGWSRPKHSFHDVARFFIFSENICQNYIVKMTSLRRHNLPRIITPNTKLLKVLLLDSKQKRGTCWKNIPCRKLKAWINGRWTLTKLRGAIEWVD